MPDILGQQQKNEIIKALEKAKATQPCPRCGNKKFAIVDGYFTQMIQTKLGILVFGGPSIPCIIAVCDQCGFMAQHARKLYRLPRGLPRGGMYALPRG